MKPETAATPQTAKPPERTPVRSTDLVAAAPKEPDWNELKLALNNAVWMHAPGTLTLAQAEEATCLAISYIAKCHNAATKSSSFGAAAP